MNEDVLWKLLDEIPAFGEFIITVPNQTASANIIGKNGRKQVIEKSACYCHVQYSRKNRSVLFIFIDA